MKLEVKLIIITSVVALSSCGTKINRIILDDSYRSSKSETIIFIEIDEQLSNNANQLGKLEFNQRFFPKECSFKEIRRKVGKTAAS